MYTILTRKQAKNIIKNIRYKLYEQQYFETETEKIHRRKCIQINRRRKCREGDGDKDGPSNRDIYGDGYRYIDGDGDGEKYKYKDKDKYLYPEPDVDRYGDADAYGYRYPGGTRGKYEGIDGGEDRGRDKV